MGVRYTTLHASVLAAELPEGSRTRIAIDPESVWTVDRTLAAAIVNLLSVIAWQGTADAVKGRNRPKPIGPKRRPASGGYDIDELDRILAMPRTEA